MSTDDADQKDEVVKDKADRTAKAIQELLNKSTLDKDEITRLLVWAEEQATDRQRAELLSTLAPRIPTDLLPLALRALGKTQDAAELKAPILALSKRMAPGLGTQVVSAFTNWRSGIGLAISILILVAAFLGLAWLCWFKWGVELWQWGHASGGARALSILGWLYLGLIPFLPAYGIAPTTTFWSALGELSDSERARAAQENIETQLLETGDEQLKPMILLLRYSRQMLSEYYAIAQSQAQRSFRYCLIAMWIGFTVLIAGVLGVVDPLRELLVVSVHAATAEPRQLGSAGTPLVTKAPETAKRNAVADSNSAEALSEAKVDTEKRAAAGPATEQADSNRLVLLTGAIIEFIAAAFLWVYRFSINQQTFYYRRQFRVHNALLAHRLSEKMQSRDEATKTIVERLLEDIDARDLPTPGASGMASLLKRP